MSTASGAPRYRVPRARWLWVAIGTRRTIRSISSSEKPSPRRSSEAWAWIRPWAHGHAFMPWAVTPTSRRLTVGLAAAIADQPVHLLGGDVGDRGPLLHRVARRDRDLAAQGALALHDGPRDVLGQLLDAQGLAQHDLVDGLVHRLLEARHVDALLHRPQVAGARHLGLEEALGAVVTDADGLRRARDAGARQADGRRRAGCPGGPRRRSAASCSCASPSSSAAVCLQCAGPEGGGQPDRPPGFPRASRIVPHRAGWGPPSVSVCCVVPPVRSSRKDRENDAGSPPAVPSRSPCRTSRRCAHSRRRDARRASSPMTRSSARSRTPTSPRTRSRTSTRTCSRSASRCSTPTAR